VTVSQLPTVNAGLNALSFCFLFAGWRMVKARRLEAHRWCMLGAVASSAVFLASYLYYHAHAGHVVYRGPGRPFYLALLLTHTVLAAAIVPMLVPTLRHAAAQRWDLHTKWSKPLLPIWLYVSVTGVVVYVMLYRL
jgi:putative membrane protein